MTRSIYKYGLPLATIVKVMIIAKMSVVLMTGRLGATDVPYLPGHEPASIYVEGIRFYGHHHSKEDWLLRYLDMSFPRDITRGDLVYIREKLLSSEVFYDVKLGFELDESSGHQKTYLAIHLKEKWTTVPVIRLEFGGGTPLKIIGVYDIHSFGRLWTLGAQGHKYGDSPWGGVLWAKNPRFLDGEHVLGFEYWRIFRQRSLYSNDGSLLLHIQSDLVKYRTFFLLPILRKQHTLGSFKLGIDFQYLRQNPSTYSSPQDNITPDSLNLTLLDTKSEQLRPLVHGEYDDIVIENRILNGTRLSTRLGPIYEPRHDSAYVVESEAFHYHFFKTSRLNLALHFFAGQATTKLLQSQYFLGGFNSIRGLPDGRVFGNRAFYSNLELWHLTKRWSHLWLQTGVFFDMGGASFSWSEALDQHQSSLGMGIRLTIPQIHRLVLRFDYAWSLDGKNHGLSAGTNDFFQPHQPLQKR